MSIMLIPPRFKPIAVRDDRLGTTVISYDADRSEYFLVVGDRHMGPLKKQDLECLLENIKDVVELKGHFISLMNTSLMVKDVTGGFSSGTL